MANKKRVLIIVAHPDDETIWMGGNLIKHKKEWDTTVISLCRASDKDREPKFRKACKFLQIKGLIFDLDDEKFQPLNQKEIKNLILKSIKKEYDYIFTHGENGEYGHIRHKEINKAVLDLINTKKLKAKKIYFFSYLKKDNDHQGYAEYNPNSDMFIKLNEIEISMKKHIITQIYGYHKGGFEELSAADVEAFTILK